MFKLANEPVILGTALKALLLAATLFGLHTTEADREAIVAAIVAVLAAIAVITKKERDSVTPMAKVESLAQETGGEALTLVDRLKGWLPLGGNDADGV